MHPTRLAGILQTRCGSWTLPVVEPLVVLIVEQLRQHLLLQVSCAVSQRHCQRLGCVGTGQLEVEEAFH